MIKKIFKVITIFIGILVAILLITYAFIYLDIRSRITNRYDINAEPIDVKYDSASLSLGKRLVNTCACTECHGSDLSGTTLIEDALIGTFVAKKYQ